MFKKILGIWRRWISWTSIEDNETTRSVEKAERPAVH